jgi:hypothetical protein
MPNKNNYPKGFNPYVAPCKPTEPRKDFYRHGNIINVSNYSSFILNGKEYAIEVNCDGDGSHDIDIIELIPEKNSKYSSEMEKYKIELETYNLENKIWNQNVKRWKEEEKLKKEAREKELYLKLKKKYES